MFQLDASQNPSNTVDDVWVRKWVFRNPLKIKFRCCDRIFLDVQKGNIDRFSPTASTLLHRLCITIMTQDLHWILKSFDVSTDFLQGVWFLDIKKRARQQSFEIKSVHQVLLRPPVNMWRYLRTMDVCINDLNFTSPHHDMYFQYMYSGWKLTALMVIHVDRLVLIGSRSTIDYILQYLEKRFGKMEPYIVKLQPVQLNRKDADALARGRGFRCGMQQDHVNAVDL